jgi:hypothetical protein
MKKTLLSSLACALCALAWATPAAAQDRQHDDFELTLVSEFGLLSTLTNQIQQGTNGTYFDYVEDGDDELFNPFLRLSAEALFAGRHNVTFLYQPLQLAGRSRLQRDVTINDALFPDGADIEWRYGFDFYRLTYEYNLFDTESFLLGLGGGFQMRIAENDFITRDMTLSRNSRNLGPVPLLKLRARYTLPSGWWFGAEVDGFYAAVRILNGDLESEIIGGVVDGSLRAGKRLRPGLDAFLNLRVVGGGSDGTSQTQADNRPGDGYTRNWAYFAAVSLGFRFDPSTL